MRKPAFVSFLLAFSSFSFSQNISGNWQGNIDVNGQKILVVFHFYKDIAGQIVGKWDCPPQNAKNLPCGEIVLKNDSVKVGLPVISGFYEGTFIGVDSITGMWHQGPGKFVLNIVKTGNDAAFVLPKRPQTPKPPFDYEVKEVTYSNANKTMRYGATFTKPFSKVPADSKKYPAVVLITGSGKQDRDENIFDHKPFAVIADDLTKRGIAVLRFDDRGMGQTTGDFDTSSTEDFAGDVEAAIKYLESRKDVDTHRIGLIGHSEGGIIAPMVAARNNQVAFIVMLAGTGVPGNVINDYQNALPLQKAGFKDDIVQKFLELHRALIKAATSYVNPNDYKKEVSKIYYDWKKKQTPETIRELIKTTDETTISTLQNKYGAFHTKWWKFFLTYDPTKDLEKISIPVLVLNGEKDIQVDPKINLSLIEKALKKSKSKNYKVLELTGLNHLFQHCNACTTEEYGTLEETFAAEALKIMGSWIEEVVKQ
ncbi:MAG: alpha/beta fold hydrolase [Ginsengibacter sp.]